MSYLFAIPFGLWGAIHAFSVIGGSDRADWLLGPLVMTPTLGDIAFDEILDYVLDPVVLAPLVVLCLLFLAARRLFKRGGLSDMRASIMRSRAVLCWFSLAAPFAAWTLCHVYEFWPWGSPAGNISLAWLLGFLGSGVLGLLAIVSVLARGEYKWLWMPLAGLGLTIPIAASTHHLIYIL